MNSINNLLQEKEVIITCGTGGVGKTTLSAALGIQGARLGKKVLVITIDPAKRLATSLGLKDLGDSPVDLTSFLTENPNSGEFHALMPDTHSTFDDFLRKLAQTPEQEEKLKQNEIFKIFTKEFSGANEYMALQKLNKIVEEMDFDLVILDTPPSRDTLSFFNAPNLLNRFFEEKHIQKFLKPANKVLSFGMNKVLGILEKLTGKGFMSNFIEFAIALFDLRIAFTKELKNVENLLHSERVGFCLVAAPSSDLAPDIRHLVGQLNEKGFQFSSFFINRCVSSLNTQDWTPMEKNEKEALELIEDIQTQEKETIEEIFNFLQSNQNTEPYFKKIPQMSRDIHSMEDLFYVAHHL